MKKISILAFPIIISQLIFQLMVLTDIWMMSKMGILEIAAGGLAGAIFSFLFVISSSMVSVVTNLLATLSGQGQLGPGKDIDIRRLLKSGVLLSGLICLVLLPVFYLMPQLFVLLNQDPTITNVAMEYIHSLKWSILPTLLLLVLRSLPVVSGTPQVILWLSITTVLLNFVASYLFAFSLNLGISGLGWGTTAASLLTVIVFSYWLFNQSRYRHFRPWGLWKEYKLSSVFPIMKMGLSVALATLAEFTLISGAALMAGTLGTVFLAVHQIALQVLSFSWNIVFGFAQATAIIIGTQFGAKATKSTLKKTAIGGLLLATLTSVLIASLVVLYPQLLIRAFASSRDNLFTELVNILPEVMLVAASCFVVDAWQLTALNILRGMHIVRSPAVITVVGYCFIGLPVAWLLMANFQLKGIWMGIGLGLAVSGCFLLARLHFSLKRLAF